jgi:1-aminocyclopropane-1-carboxylate deaminase
VVGVSGFALEDRDDRQVVGIDASKTLEQTVDQVTRIANDTADKIEGMLTDPVYEGKSMAGLIGMVRSGEIPAGSSVLYAHLGGQPALSAYASVRGLG